MAFLSRCIKRYALISTSHSSPSIFQKGHNSCRKSSSYSSQNETTNIVFSTHRDEPYNVNTYQLPLSDEQHGEVLQTLNKASLKQLTDFKLPKGAAQKLISARQRKGSFKHIRELLLVEGIGLKRIERVCQHIINFDAHLSKEEKRAEKRARTLFAPKWSSHNNQDVHSVVGLSLTGSALCWCLLQHSAPNSPAAGTGPPAQSGPGEAAVLQTTTPSAESERGSWRVANLNHRVLSPFKMVLPSLYDQACRALEEIPLSDAYVLTDQITVKSKMNSDELATSLIHEHMKGLLAVALNCRAGVEVPVDSSLRESPPKPDDVQQDINVVYYAKEKLASKALVLKAASQRVMGAVAASSLLSGAAPAPLPGLTVSAEAESVYKGLAANHQHGVNTALLLALAFTLLSS